MRKGIIYLLIAVLLLLAPAGLRYLRFYTLGKPERAAPPAYEPARIEQVPTPEAVDFSDEPEASDGLILLDRAHRNNFTVSEIGYLDGRLAARGVELLPFTNGDLATALRPVNAFVVISPLDPFSLPEILAVTDFVSRGGRLLLVGDPTRFEVFIDEESFDFDFTLETDEMPLNSLANEFDIIFNGDYLYNTTENEGNFRNIIVDSVGLTESDLVDGLERLVFYSAHSLQIGPTGEVLAKADENTWSSATDRPGGLVLAGMSNEGRVLALGDIHFLIEPYYTVYDNGRFITKVADFLAEPSRRSFKLADFPFFYTAPVDLIYLDSPDLGPDAFDEIISLQAAFREVDQTLSLSSEPQTGHDTLYLGLYNRVEEVADILASSGISLTIKPPILTEAEMREMGEEEDEEQVDEEEAETTEEEIDEEEAAADESEEVEPEETLRLIQSGLGNVQMSGTALILLEESSGHRRVIVLAASHDGLENTIGRLMDLIPFDADYALADCLLQENVALCPSNVADEEVEAELATGGAPEIPEEEVVEEEVPEEEEEEEELDESELDATDQGSIALGETVTASLAAEETHSWTFGEGPTTVDIIADAEELDLVLELYGPDNELIDSADNGFSGEGEELLAVEIPDDADYHILIYAFFGREGDYSLSVAPASETDQNGGGIFIFVDDDGQPLSGGLTSVDALVALLTEEHPVTTWISTIEGPLDIDTLLPYDLLIWDSGDYRDEAGFLDEDTAVIFEYLDAGGDVFITGQSPTILGDSELAQLADLEVAGDDPVLLDGFEPGEIIILDQVYDAVAGESLDPDTDENAVAFFLRGPESEAVGNVVGIAIEENDQRTVLLLAPFIALPGDVQERLLDNLIAWFGLSSS